MTLSLWYKSNFSFLNSHLNQYYPAIAGVTMVQDTLNPAQDVVDSNSRKLFFQWFRNTSVYMVYGNNQNINDYVSIVNTFVKPLSILILVFIR